VKAWRVDHQAPAAEEPLVLVEGPDPEPGPGEVRVRVSTCGVCRTDLHIAEGDVALRRGHVVPGHEVVGYVDATGPGAQRFSPGERIGIPWLRHTCGECRFCRSGRENLCTAPRFTGWDEDGGYAELAVVPEDFAYRLPAAFTDEKAAPLLCAGIIGYRALRQSRVRPGQTLGIYGFGGSAHLAAQIAISEGTTVRVFTRSEKARRLALDLGCASAGDTREVPPGPLDAGIVFAPSGDVVPVAMSALDRGATLAIAGIHLSDIPALEYQKHLFYEREIRSVTANTRTDGEEFLAAAARIQVEVETTAYGFADADRALSDLAEGRVSGAAVLELSET
jgi:alcohol dehydrogenase, propanol-preferring